MKTQRANTNTSMNTNADGKRDHTRRGRAAWKSRTIDGTHDSLFSSVFPEWFVFYTLYLYTYCIHTLEQKQMVATDLCWI